MRKRLALAWGILWTILLAGAATILWVRRMDGMFTTPLGTGWLFLSSFFTTLTTLVTLGVLATSLLEEPSGTPPRRKPLPRPLTPRLGIFLAWALAMVVLLLLIRMAILIPGTPYLGQLFWRLSFPTAVIALAVFTLPLVFDERKVQEKSAGDAESEKLAPTQTESSVAAQPTGRGAKDAVCVEDVGTAVETPEDEENDEDGEEEEAEECPLPPGVTQQLSRTSDEHGDTLEGLLRTRFTPGQARTAVHVAFCPPFAKTPEIACHMMEGDAKIETPVHATPHGAGIQLKKGQCEEIVIYFRANQPE